MGRTKGQLEKFDLRGLDKVDHFRVLLRGKEGRAARFSELEEFEDGLQRFLTDPNFGHEITMEEASGMLESLSDYFREVRWKIQRRIEEAEDEAKFWSSTTSEDGSHTTAPENPAIDILRKLDEMLRSAEERRQNSEAAREAHSVEDPRMVAFKIYIGLESRLGRIPSRSEIDAEDPGGAKARAVSRAVERMGLRMTDQRIRMYLERVLEPFGPLPLGRGASRSTGLQISSALSNLSVNSPEARFMKLPLRRANMDRLVRVILDDRLGSILADEYELLPQNSPSETASLPLGDSGATIELGPMLLVIDGKKEIAELLEAFRAIAKTWMRVRSFGLDLAWVQPGRSPDYENVLDILILSIFIHEEARRSVAAWISETIRHPHLRSLVIKVSPQSWNPPSSMITIWVDLSAGIERLFCLVEGDGRVGRLCLEEWMERDEMFAGLVEFLEPFDAILKALDYGVEALRIG